MQRYFPTHGLKQRAPHPLLERDPLGRIGQPGDPPFQFPDRDDAQEQFVFVAFEYPAGTAPAGIVVCGNRGSVLVHRDAAALEWGNAIAACRSDASNGNRSNGRLSEMTMKLALLIAVAVMSPSASAGDIYKCQDAAGKIEFRDRPCDAAQKSQKVDITPNSVRTMTLDEVRAKSAELEARQQARQEAENKANADAYAAQERGWQRERALQDAIDLQQAIRDSGAYAAPTYYYNGYFARQQRPHRPQRPGRDIGIQPQAVPPPPKAPPMPPPPPKPPAGM